MKRIINLLLALIVFVSLPTAALAIDVDNSFANDSDLIIEVETITQRSYAGTAVTDRYNIDLLTEKSYELARQIAVKREQDYHVAKASLFVEAVEDAGMDQVALATEQLGLFGDDYTLSNTGDVAAEADDNILLIVLILCLGMGTGVALAIVLQRKRGGTQK